MALHVSWGTASPRTSLHSFPLSNAWSVKLQGLMHSLYNVAAPHPRLGLHFPMWLSSALISPLFRLFLKALSCLSLPTRLGPLSRLAQMTHHVIVVLVHAAHLPRLTRPTHPTCYTLVDSVPKATLIYSQCLDHFAHQNYLSSLALTVPYAP